MYPFGAYLTLPYHTVPYLTSAVSPLTKHVHVLLYVSPSLSIGMKHRCYYYYYGDIYVDDHAMILLNQNTATYIQQQVKHTYMVSYIRINAAYTMHNSSQSVQQ